MALSLPFYIYGKCVLIYTQPDFQFEVVAMKDYSQRTTEDLSFTKGEVLTVLDICYGDWWFARNQKG